MTTHRLPICHFTVLLILVAKHCRQISTCFSTIFSTFLPGRRTLSLVRAYPEDFQSVAMTRLDSSNLRPRLWDASSLSSHGPGNAIIQLSRLGIWCLWNSVAFMKVFFPSLSVLFHSWFLFCPWAFQEALWCPCITVHWWPLTFSISLSSSNIWITCNREIREFLVLINPISQEVGVLQL